MNIDKIRINKAKEDPFLRIYGSEKYKNIYQHDLIEFPFVIDVEPTNACFLNCLMCNRQIMKREIGFMDFETLKKIVDEVSQHKESSIRFSGWGEPTMNKNIVKFIEYANSKGVLTHMTTNGFKMDDEFVKSLFNAGLDKIKFSFQGATKEEYERIRNNKDYDFLVERIKQTVKIRNQMNAKTFIQVSTSVTDDTKEEIQKFIDFWIKIVDGVFGVGREGDNYLTSFARISSLDRVKSLGIKKSRTPGDKVHKNKCSEIRTKLNVSWNGNIKACCSDFDDSLLLGNIKDNSLKEVWTGKKLTNLRKIIESGQIDKFPDFCKGCDFIL